MSPIKLFMALVRWNQMLLLCPREKDATLHKYGGPSLHGGKDFMEQKWMMLGYKQAKACHETRLAFSMWHFPESVQIVDSGSVGWSTSG